MFAILRSPFAVHDLVLRGFHWDMEERPHLSSLQRALKLEKAKLTLIERNVIRGNRINPFWSISVNDREMEYLRKENFEA